MKSAKPTGILLILAVTAALLACSAPAMAATGPKWRIDSMAATKVAPGALARYLIQVTNVGDVALDGAVQPIVLSGTLPAGFSFKAVKTTLRGMAGLNCSASAATTVSCTDKTDKVRIASESVTESSGVVRIDAAVSSLVAPGTRTASFQVSGGGAASAATTVDPTLIANDPAAFGIDAFDAQVAADQSGTPFTQAGGHPYAASTAIDFETTTNPLPLKEDLWPVEATRDVRVDLPPGFIGNPTAADTCTVAQLANTATSEARPFCPPTSQVGTTLLRNYGGKAGPSAIGPLPVFAMLPPPGVPARFGFNVFGVLVTLDAALRSGGDYGLSVNARNISEGLALAGSTVSIWGVPADQSHDSERACPGEAAPTNGGPTCPGAAEPIAFFRNPTSCAAPAGSPVQDGLVTSLAIDSWAHPGAWSEGAPVLSDPAWKSASFVSHDSPGYPYSPNDPKTPWGPHNLPTDCAAVPFTPTLSAQPTTSAADSPSGLRFDLTIPQEALRDPDAIAQADLRSARVLLPAGMSVNPSSANGLGACSSAQVALHSNAPANCPDDAKIGEVEIKTPLLEHAVKGGVYLAKQGDNPFGSLLALYLAIDDPQSGVVLKLPGHVVAGSNGQLETTFSDQPQLPFESLHLQLYGGPRAPLRTPSSCGTYATEATLTPWSANAPVDLQSSFEITSGPGGSPCPKGAFDPKLSAGTTNPLAGAFSPFTLRLSREDGTQELAGLSLRLPEGLLGKPAGIPYCPEAALGSISSAEGTGQAQLANPSCPPGSQVGTVVVGAGAGPEPLYVSTGKAYWAGPYKGAPFSLAILTPALAGPFDLGNVLVRTALHVDPTSAQLSAVSDPLPTILHGIPLDLRDVRVDMGRPNFTLNPTSCDPMAITSTITSTEGRSASPSSRFQVSSCANLPFKPKLSLALKGGTKRGDYPALTATLKARPGDANIGRVSAALPHSEFLAQNHIRTICTRVQYAADQCPPGSIYGYAKAITPLLDKPLEGPVYLRSSSHPLPDLVMALHGQIEIDLAGRIDSVKGGIRTSFETVPDAPVSKFILSMKGGKKGLLVNSRNLCRSTNKAKVLVDGQNGKTADRRVVLRSSCRGKAPKAKAHGKSGKR